jgi:hypothetical protein
MTLVLGYLKGLYPFIFGCHVLYVWPSVFDFFVCPIAFPFGFGGIHKSTRDPLGCYSVWHASLSNFSGTQSTPGILPDVLTCVHLLFHSDEYWFQLVTYMRLLNWHIQAWSFIFLVQVQFLFLHCPFSYFEFWNQDWRLPKTRGYLTWKSYLI